MSFGGLLVFFGKCLLQWSHQIWDTCVVSKPESLAISSPSKKQQLATFLWPTYWHHPIQFSYQVKKNGQPTANLDSLSRLILTRWFGVTIVLQALGIRNSHPSTHTMDFWGPNPFILQAAGKCRGGNGRTRPLIYFWAAQQDNQGAEREIKGRPYRFRRPGFWSFEGEVLPTPMALLWLGQFLDLNS